MSPEQNPDMITPPPAGPPKLEIVPPAPVETTPPPADTPEQVETRLNQALSDAELDSRAREVAEQIVATQPEITPAPEAPVIPPAPASELPDMTPLTSQDLPPAAEVTTPFAPTREAVAAQEAARAAEKARGEQLVADGKEIMDRGVELGILSPTTPESTEEAAAPSTPEATPASTTPDVPAESTSPEQSLTPEA